MRYSILLLAQFFVASLFAATSSEVPFQKRESTHIKEILTAWDATNGEYLYKSMSALVMHEQQPDRPKGMNKTPFELIQSMDSQRINRLQRAASSELENERNAGQSDRYYWEDWKELLDASQCSTSRGNSNGDPHMRTFDKESYDFQNAGDYLLTASEDNTFMIQTQQVRMGSNISLNGAVAMNINGDVVEMRDIEENKGQVVFVVNGEQLPNSRADIVLPQGGVVNYQSNKKYVVKWPTGEQMAVGVRNFNGKQLYDLTVFVPECRDTYYGLLGNNDGVKNDIVAFDPDTGRELTREDMANSSEDDFGNRRRAPEYIDRKTRDSRFISRVFGREYQLDSETSIFTNQMTDIPDEIRYPQEYLSLAELTDEQIKEGLRKAREAGVADEDLYGAVYDYGHLGLEPVAYDDNYTKPSRAISKEPELTRDEASTKTANNRNNSSVRVRPTVFVGTGVRVPPVRHRGPTYRNPTQNNNSGGSATTPTRRTPNSGNQPTGRQGNGRR